MKKILLFMLALMVGFTSYAQQPNKFKFEPIHKTRSEIPAIGIEPLKDAAMVRTRTISKKLAPPSGRNVNIVNIVDIGTMANAYAYASNNIGCQHSLVWAEPELNVVTSFHRMGGDLDPGGYSGDLGYDISFDGGMTWTNQIECYVAVDNAGGEYYRDAARYPNHGLYNPTGSVDDAYVVFFCPNLDQSNGSSWGGYTFGVANISDPSDTTGNYNRKSSHDEFYQYIPDGFDVTSQGLSIVTDRNSNWTSGSFEYGGGLIVNMGYWDDDEQDIVYEEIDWEFENNGEAPWFNSVAFSPDGMTGYIAVLANNGETFSVPGQPNIYPIYWKTVDGGENWDGPHAIQIDGPDGIGGIVNHLLTDEQIEQIYLPPVPARDEIPYTFLGDFDIAVTADGNLHIAGIVAAAGEAEDGISFYVEDGLGCVLDLFTDDGGTTWYVEEMGRTFRYSATFGELEEGNRTQITLNPDADRVFISWLDTELEDEENNGRPNIWCRGFNPSTYMKTYTGDNMDAPTNVTAFSDAMWEAYFGTAAKTALELEDGVYTIPYTYCDMDPSDPLLPVQLKYIQDFSFSEADFTITGLGKEVSEDEHIVSISQNYPNPFNGNTYVTINLTEGVDLSLVVYSITGQQVLKQDYGYTAKGTTTLTINGTDLTPGIYFYTVNTGSSKITRKMIVE